MFQTTNQLNAFGLCVLSTIRGVLRSVCRCQRIGMGQTYANTLRFGHVQTIDCNSCCNVSSPHPVGSIWVNAQILCFFEHPNFWKNIEENSQLC